MANSKLTTWATAVALSGFLFGFDTIVINGADKPIQDLWPRGDWYHSTFIMSMALWGTVLGALLGGIPCNKYGRKPTLFWIGIFYLVGAIGTALAPTPEIFSFCRFMGGLGVGASSVAAPIYISEIAPAKNRGRLVALYQFNLVLGILLAFLSNWLIGKYVTEDVAWRWMLGIMAIPSILYIVLVMAVPESPRWLILKGQEDEARKTLNAINDNPDEVQKEMDAIKAVGVQMSTDKSTFFSGQYSAPMFLAFMIALFNQMSGINFVLYYATRIFEDAGMSREIALASGIWLGIVNFIFTYIGLYLIDKVGRKSLMYMGSFGYIMFLAGVAWAFKTNASGPIVVAMVCGFIASHAIGQGAVIWVFISEIFPNKVRDYGMAWGSSTHWVFAAIITMVTLPILKAFSPVTVFSFFSFMMFLQLLWVHFLMPETKGTSLEDMERKVIH